MASLTTLKGPSNLSRDICNAESVDGMQPSPASCYAPVLAVIAAEKLKWQNLKVRSGLTDDEKNRFRKERNEIVLAKIMALEDAEQAVSRLPEPESLTVKKSIFSEILVAATLHEGHAHFYGERGIAETAAVHRHKRDALNALLLKLSGSAGTQPLNGEEPPAIGENPVTPGATLPCVSALSVLEWLKVAKVSEVEALSEACLDELERRGAVVHWSLTGF